MGANGGLNWVRWRLVVYILLPQKAAAPILHRHLTDFSNRKITVNSPK